MWCMLPLCVLVCRDSSLIYYNDVMDLLVIVELQFISSIHFFLSDLASLPFFFGISI